MTATSNFSALSLMSALLGDVGNGLEATSIAQRVAGTFS